MIESLRSVNDRNIKLHKFSEEELDKLYLRVFDTPDGELVLQDLANRAYVYTTTALGDSAMNHQREGMRALYVSIISRLQGAVAPQKKEEASE